MGIIIGTYCFALFSLLLLQLFHSADISILSSFSEVSHAVKEVSISSLAHVPTNRQHNITAVRPVQMISLTDLESRGRGWRQQWRQTVQTLFSETITADVQNSDMRQWRQRVNQLLETLVTEPITYTTASHVSKSTVYTLPTSNKNDVVKT